MAPSPDGGEVALGAFSSDTSSGKLCGNCIMDSVDLQVLKSGVDWLKAGHRVVLATVVETWGSAPRPAGALLAIRDDGQVSGSVSGGCVEDDLIDRIRNHDLAGARPEIVVYGIA